MKQIRSLGVVRQRGQFTIPDAIRSSVHWLTENGVVLITLLSSREVRLEPYEQKRVSMQWSDVKKRMEHIQSLPGKKVKLSQFILDDRKQRR